MESIKCSAEAVDIYIFLLACSALEPQQLQKRLLEIQHGYCLIPTISRKQHIQFLSSGSSGAAVDESTAWFILDKPHPREHSQPQHCSQGSLRKFPFASYLCRYEKEQECSHCLNFVFSSPASCFKKDTDSHR